MRTQTIVMMARLELSKLQLTRELTPSKKSSSKPGTCSRLKIGMVSVRSLNKSSRKWINASTKFLLPTRTRPYLGGFSKSSWSSRNPSRVWQTNRRKIWRKMFRNATIVPKPLLLSISLLLEMKIPDSLPANLRNIRLIHLHLLMQVKRLSRLLQRKAKMTLMTQMILTIAQMTALMTVMTQTILAKKKRLRSQQQLQKSQMVVIQTTVILIQRTICLSQENPVTRKKKKTLLLTPVKVARHSQRSMLSWLSLMMRRLQSKEDGNGSCTNASLMIWSHSSRTLTNRQPRTRSSKSSLVQVRARQR